MLCSLKSFVFWLMFSAVFFAGPSAIADSHGQRIGAAEKVNGEVYGNNLLRRLNIGDELLKNQRVRAGVDSAADLRFLDRSRLTVGARSEIVLDEFVYDPDAKATRGSVKLLRGVLRYTSAAFDGDVKFETPAVTIGIRGTVLDVMVTDGSTEVVVHEGRVEVTGRHGSVVLGPGRSVFIGVGDELVITELDPSGSNPGSAAIQDAVSDMLSRVGAAPDADGAPQKAQKPDRNPNIDTALSDTPHQGVREQSANALPQQARDSAASPAPMSDSIQGKDLEDLLYLDLADGRVIIELRRDLAPRHVARIKELVRAGFYDGLKFHSVIPGRFSMTGDPTGTGRGGSGTRLKPEFSQEAFRRGSVGMAYDRGKPDTADSQFFVSVEPFPAIDGKYTLWGQVIQGMQIMDQLQTGNPPANPDTILRMRVAADVTGE